MYLVQYKELGLYKMEQEEGGPKNEQVIAQGHWKMHIIMCLKMTKLIYTILSY